MDTDFEITVARDDKVTGSANNQTINGQLTLNDGLHPGDHEFDIEPESWGFAAKQKR